MHIIQRHSPSLHPVLIYGKLFDLLINLDTLALKVIISGLSCTAPFLFLLLKTLRLLRYGLFTPQNNISDVAQGGHRCGLGKQPQVTGACRHAERGPGVSDGRGMSLMTHPSVLAPGWASAPPWGGRGEGGGRGRT